MTIKILRVASFTLLELSMRNCFASSLIFSNDPFRILSAWVAYWVGDGGGMYRWVYNRWLRGD